jgi:hypothetical protein
MTAKHEPDPRFVEKLEWQLSGELRRLNRSGMLTSPSVRILKIAALVVVSIGLGAGAMEASQQIQESWRAELLQARLEVQLELARRRVELQLEAVEQTRAAVERGVQSSRELLHAEVQLAQVQADQETTELELEEIRESGREPLGEVSSPLVNGRDFVSEKIQARMRAAQLHLNTVRAEAERARSLVEADLVSSRESQGYSLAVREAELQLQALERRLEVRQAYLKADISAVEAELQVVALEIENRIVLLNEQREYFQSEWQRLQDLADRGAVSATELTGMQIRLAEIEGQLRSAQVEQGIVRRELERRAGSN